MDDQRSTTFQLSGEIPVESFRQVYIELMFSPDGPAATRESKIILLAKASGFLYRVGAQTFLVTARHCFAGKHWESDRWLSKNYHVEPTHVAIGFRSAMPAEGFRHGEPVPIHHFLIKLVDEGWKPIWLEHPRYGPSVDVAAIPFNIPEGYGDLIFESWDAAEAGTQDFATKLWVSEHLAVVGYPYGLRGSFDLPIWTAGSVSSEPAMMQPYRDRAYPLVLIDARTRTGQSGSAVVTVRQPFCPTMNGNELQFSPAPQWRLVGVYSGRVPEDYGRRQGSVFGAELPQVENAVEQEVETKANPEGSRAAPRRNRDTASSDLGFVWRIEEATEICQQGVPGGTGPRHVDPGDSPPRLLGPDAKPE